MALVDLKSNLANFRSNFVTPGVEKKNAPEASTLNIDTIPVAYSGKTKFTVQYVDRNSKFNKDGINIKFSPTGVYLPNNFTIAKINSSKFNIDTTPDKFSPSGMYLPELFTTKKINSSKYNIDKTPTKFSPSGIYLPELFTTKKINSSKYNIDTTPSKFSPNTKYVPTKYYPENIIKPTITRWSGKTPPAVNFIDDKTSNAKGFTINLGKSGAYEKSQFISFDYKKSISTRNSKFDQGNASLINQLGKGSPFPDSLYYNDGRPATGPAYSWLPKEHTGFYSGNTYSTAAGKVGFLAPTYNTNSPIDELYKKYNLQDAANSETSTGPNSSYIRQPFIERGIQRKGKESPQRWGIGNFDDGLIRGGITTTLERAAVDTARIAKWMASPRGLLWIVKQIGLGLTNPKVEAPAGRFGRATRIHAGVTSLLSVAGNALGLHFTRHGLPFRNEIASYEKVLINKKVAFDSRPEASNRLIDLRTRLGLGKEANFPKSELSKGKEIDLLSDNIGGPNSVYGIGNTTIKRHTDTREDAIYYASINSGINILRINSYKSPYAAFLKARTNEPRDTDGSITPSNITSIDSNDNKFSLRGKYDDSIKATNAFVGPASPDQQAPVISKNIYKPASILNRGNADKEGKDLVERKKFNVNFAKARTGHDLDNTKTAANGPNSLTEYDKASQLRAEISKFETTGSSFTPGAKTSKNDSSARTIETYDLKKNTYPVDNQNQDINKYITLAYNKIPKSNKVGRKFNDFREDIVNSGNAQYSEDKGLIGYRGENYHGSKNLETKYGFGKLGEVGIDRSNSNEFIVKADGSNPKDPKALGDLAFGRKGDRTRLSGDARFRGDRITAINVVNEIVNPNEIYPEGASDLIKFFFEDGNKGINVMPFRCTLISLSDNFSPGWEQISIMGRPDGAYLYTSFERSISFSFKIAALSRSEMFPMWRKLNRLATYTMPDFDGKNGRPSGPFMRISIGNLFQRTPGFITSLNYSIPDDSTWDIGEDIDLVNNPTPKQLPMVVEASVNYTVVGDYRPQLNGRVYSLEPLGGSRNDVGDWLRDAKITSPVIVPTPPIKVTIVPEIPAAPPTFTPPADIIEPYGPGGTPRSRLEGSPDVQNRTISPFLPLITPP